MPVTKLLRVVLCLIVVVVGGVIVPSQGAFAAETEAAARIDLRRALHIHLNGIGGRRMIDRVLVDALDKAGFEAEHVFFDWTEGKTGLVALQGHEQHKVQARRLADLMIEQHRRDPKRLFFITAHSGGAGIAAFALEMLPEAVQVESVVFFAPALSPQYDLSRALRQVHGHLYVFSSPLDSIVLSTGTKMFGTIDGVKSEAAGLNGFVAPEDADAEQYRKLVAYPYQRTWLKKFGNAGTHICAMRPKFAREFVAPVLLELPLSEEAQEVSGKGATGEGVEEKRSSAGRTPAAF